MTEEKKMPDTPLKPIHMSEILTTLFCYACWFYGCFLLANRHFHIMENNMEYAEWLKAILLQKGMHSLM